MSFIRRDIIGVKDVSSLPLVCASVYVNVCVCVWTGGCGYVCETHSTSPLLLVYCSLLDSSLCDFISFFLTYQGFVLWPRFC